MAGIPSNRFKTVVSVVSMTDAPIYTAPPGVTTIVQAPILKLYLISLLQ